MSFTPYLQLKKFADIPVSTRKKARESRPHTEETRYRLLAREEASFPCVVGKEFPAFPSHLRRSRSPQEKPEELQGRATMVFLDSGFESRGSAGKTGFPGMD